MGSEEYSLTGRQLIILAWVTVVLNLFILAVRVHVRWRNSQNCSRAIWSDIFHSLAWCSFASFVSLDTYLYTVGFFKPPPSNPVAYSLTARNVYSAEGIMYLNTMYCVKLGILCVYWELLPNTASKWCKISLKILFAMIPLGLVIEIMGIFLGCRQAGWSGVIHIWCHPNEPRKFNTGTLVALVVRCLSDLWLYIYPIPILLPVFRSNILSFHKKVLLFMSFFMGLVSIVFGAVALQLSSEKDAPEKFRTWVWFFFTLEQCYALHVVSFPPFINEAARLWKKYLPIFRCKFRHYRDSDLERSGSSTEMCITATKESKAESIGFSRVKAVLEPAKERLSMIFTSKGSQTSAGRRSVIVEDRTGEA